MLNTYGENAVKFAEYIGFHYFKFNGHKWSTTMIPNKEFTTEELYNIWQEVINKQDKEDKQ